MQTPLFPADDNREEKRPDPDKPQGPECGPDGPAHGPMEFDAEKLKELFRDTKLPKKARKALQNLQKSLLSFLQEESNTPADSQDSEPLKRKSKHERMRDRIIDFLGKAPEQHVQLLVESILGAAIWEKKQAAWAEGGPARALIAEELSERMLPELTQDKIAAFSFAKFLGHAQTLPSTLHQKLEDLARPLQASVNEGKGSLIGSGLNWLGGVLESIISLPVAFIVAPAAVSTQHTIPSQKSQELPPIVYPISETKSLPTTHIEDLRDLDDKARARRVGEEAHLRKLQLFAYEFRRIAFEAEEVRRRVNFEQLQLLRLLCDLAEDTRVQETNDRRILASAA